MNSDNDLLAVILVGLPGSGKSTWVNENIDREEMEILSTDNYIDNIAEKTNKTYSEVFKQEIKNATSNLNANFRKALKERRSFVWDQTNLSEKKRRGILSQIPNDYYKIAVFFKVNDDVLFERLNEREKNNGKHIPINILEQMKNSMKEPSLDEGFDKLVLHTTHKEIENGTL